MCWLGEGVSLNWFELFGCIALTVPEEEVLVFNIYRYSSMLSAAPEGFRAEHKFVGKYCIAESFLPPSTMECLQTFQQHGVSSKGFPYIKICTQVFLRSKPPPMYCFGILCLLHLPSSDTQEYSQWHWLVQGESGGRGDHVNAPSTALYSALCIKWRRLPAEYLHAYVIL